jgi:hypothetical protein
MVLNMYLFGLGFCQVLNVIRLWGEVFWYTEHLCGLNFVAVLPCTRNATIVYCDFTRVQDKVWMTLTHCYKVVSRFVDQIVCDLWNLKVNC